MLGAHLPTSRHLAGRRWLLVMHVGPTRRATDDRTSVLLPGRFLVQHPSARGVRQSFAKGGVCWEAWKASLIPFTLYDCRHTGRRSEFARSSWAVCDFLPFLMHFAGSPPHACLRFPFSRMRVPFLVRPNEGRDQGRGRVEGIMLCSSGG